MSQHQQEDSKDLVNGREEPYDEDNRKIIDSKFWITKKKRIRKQETDNRGKPSSVNRPLLLYEIL